MKTKTIKSLKKEVLVIELPINGYWEVLSTETRFKCFDTGEKLILKNYTLLGKPDEIKEDDVIDLVEQSLHTNLFAHYVSGINPPNIYQYKTALESFNSAIEKEIYWNNPVSLERADLYRKAGNEFSYNGIMKCWNEAQLNTFEKSRTLIFVKK